ncbi:radical SAM/SPASM domain-containing protein [Candidatus Omnitrophota bacterium]
MQLGGLYEKVISKNIPLFACLEITTACNNDCVHCYNVGNHSLPLDVIKRCMDEAAELGTLFLSVTGGEPMLREDIWDILSYSVEKGFATLLYTNATMIGQKEAALLKEIGIYHVDTTLLGACAETHDALTGVKGSFEGTINALKALKEEGISMAVKTPVMKGNAAEVEDIRIMVESMDINHIASPLIFTKDDGNTAPLCHRPDDGQLKDFFLLREVKSLTDCNAGYSCHFGRCTFAIKADGDVNPCVSVPFSLGNVKESSLKKIWQENSDLELIRKTGAEPLSECSDCDLAGWCFRCEGISFTEEGRLFARSDELCRMARIRKEASHGRSQEEKGKKEIQQTADRAC